MSQGFIIYICITFIPWIGLGIRLYFISNGDFDPKQDPKILTLLGIWAIGFTIFWFAIDGFNSSNFAPYCGRFIPC